MPAPAPDAGWQRAPEPAVSDAELVAALRAGDPDAAATLFDRHALDVRRVLGRVLGFDPEFEDLIHDVFVQALEGIARLQDPDRLRSWLVGISVNVARTRIRRRRRRWWMILLPHDEIPESEAPSESRNDSEICRATYRVLDRLDADDRVAIALRVLEGMELSEVASACGVSLATVKRRLNRGQKRFRELAADEPSLLEWSEGGEP